MATNITSKLSTLISSLNQNENQIQDYITNIINSWEPHTIKFLYDIWNLIINSIWDIFKNVHLNQQLTARVYYEFMNMKIQLVKTLYAMDKLSYLD